MCGSRRSAADWVKNNWCWHWPCILMEKVTQRERCRRCSSHYGVTIIVYAVAFWRIMSRWLLWNTTSSHQKCICDSLGRVISSMATQDYATVRCKFSRSACFSRAFVANVWASRARRALVFIGVGPILILVVGRRSGCWWWDDNLETSLLNINLVYLVENLDCDKALVFVSSLI